MNVDVLKNAKRIGEFTLNKKKNVKKNLNFSKDDKLSQDNWKKNEARVYFIILNGKIVKIGGSNAKGGICGTISPYCGGNGGRPSDRTFGVNWLIEKELRSGNKVELYCQWMPAVRASVPSLLSTIHEQVSFSYKNMEEACVKEYLELNNGTYPMWNFQEANREWPKEIQEGRRKLLESK